MAAGNEWVSGYLEAILDAGAKLREKAAQPRQLGPSLSTKLREFAKVADEPPSPAAAERPALYSPTKYFVEEVVGRFDDQDLHKTWTKVVAMRDSQERSSRLENLCWRIWHVTRKKKQVEREYLLQVAQRKLAQERGSKEATEDLSELSEGEKDGHFSRLNSTGAGGGGSGPSLAHLSSDVRAVGSDDEFDVAAADKHLYIVLISIHGLVRGDNMELGRDSDTGGQVKYVVELARALAATKGVYRVDLLTRQIAAPDVDWTYGEPVEMLSMEASPDSGDSGGAYIVRLPCGPKEKYVAKESLWPHIPEFVERALAHITNVAVSLGEELGGGAVWPYVIHGHYADAAEVAAHLASALNVPMVMTGHSLGRNKLEQLLKLGRMTPQEIDAAYHIARRIEAEEVGLDAAEMVVTSTKQEIEEQWGLYDGFDLRVERKLRVRRKRGVGSLGRYMPRMVVIPPGMDFSHVKIGDSGIDGDAGDLQALVSGGQASKANLPPIWSEVMRFFTNPHKPMILALSRPDPKKNVTTLLKAYGESRHLRELANLTLILGNRDDIEEMAGSGAAVLTTVLKLIDRYDLYGQVAYPKKHTQSDVPQIYRLAAKTKGVFINPALVEPFGLTLIEAAAYGLPVVATKNGGPVDILKVLNNGLLVDPHDAGAITDALLRLLSDKSSWSECRRNGLRNIHRFSWPHHCRLYLSHLAAICPDAGEAGPLTPRLRGLPDPTAEPLSDSLRDLSLHFSVDASDAGSSSVADIVDAIRRRRPTTGVSGAAGLNVFSPGRRLRLVVIAADCYGADGSPVIHDLAQVIGKAVAAGGSFGGRVGYVLSTGSAVHEAVQALKDCGVDPADFDALICHSGAELCYPWKQLAADEEYAAHVGFRWPAEHVRSAVLRLAAVSEGSNAELAIDQKASSGHCHAYAVGDPAKVKRVDALRHELRMRGFRCNLVYTRACTRLNVVPLYASRPRALRYLSIQWAMDMSKVAVFVGDKGDTDHERLLPGLHKTVVFPGVVAHSSAALLRGEDGYKTEDVAAPDASNITVITHDAGDTVEIPNFF